MDVNVDAYIVKCSVATDEIECRDSKPGHSSIVYGAEPENQLVFDNTFFNYWSSTNHDADNIVWPGGVTCNARDEGLCALRQGFGGADSQNYVRKTYGEPDDVSTLGYSRCQWRCACAPPVPWLFGSGLMGLVEMARRKAA